MQRCPCGKASDLLKYESCMKVEIARLEANIEELEAKVKKTRAKPRGRPRNRTFPYMKVKGGGICPNRAARYSHKRLGSSWVGVARAAQLSRRKKK